MAIKLKHAGTISGGSGRSKNGPQMSDASRVDTGGHIVTAQAVVGRTSAHPGAGGGGGGHAPLVSAPHGASMISAPPVSGGSARGGGGGVRVGGKGKGASAVSNARRGGITSYSSKTAPQPQRPDPDFWVTGYDPKVRPDKYSVWNPQTQQWERGKVAYQNWLGGMGDERRGDLAEAADERKFTEAQRREVEQLNAVYERARKSGRYTPEELTQIGGQIEERKRAIQPLSSLPEESAQAGFDKRIVTAPGGQKGYIDGRGNFVALPGSPSDVTPEMWNRWYVEESRIKAMGKDEKGQDVPRDRTREEIAQAVAAREAEYKKRFAPPPETLDTPSAPTPGQPGTISVTQNGKTTTMTVDDVMRDPQMIKNLKEHWSVGEGMNPQEGNFSFVGPVKPKPQSATSSSPSSATPSDTVLFPVEPGEMGGGEGRPQPKKGLLLLDQGKLPDYAKNASGGEVASSQDGETPPAEGGDSGGESAPPPKKEKKED